MPVVTQITCQILIILHFCDITENGKYVYTYDHALHDRVSATKYLCLATFYPIGQLINSDE